MELENNLRFLLIFLCSGDIMRMRQRINVLRNLAERRLEDLSRFDARVQREYSQIADIKAKVEALQAIPLRLQQTNTELRIKLDAKRSSFENTTAAYDTARTQLESGNRRIENLANKRNNLDTTVQDLTNLAKTKNDAYDTLHNNRNNARLEEENVRRDEATARQTCEFLKVQLKVGAELIKRRIRERETDARYGRTLENQCKQAADAFKAQQHTHLKYRGYLEKLDWQMANANESRAEILGQIYALEDDIKVGCELLWMN